MSFFILWFGCIIATIIIAQQKNLNPWLFAVFSFFMAPIALLLVILVKANDPPISSSQGFDLSQARRQLFEMRSQIKDLQEKIDRVEGHINQLSPTDQTWGDAMSAIIKEESIEVNTQRHTKKESFEETFGKYWLSRIGVIFFVIGIALFISYTFKYFNAYAKIGLGLTLASLFFVWGRYLEKQTAFQKMAWAVLGGAWGLLYLSVYATHYISVTRVIDQPLMTLLLLTAVSITAVICNLKYQSWIVTAIAFVLAFFTACLGDMSYASIGYFVLLVASVSYLSCQRQWPQLLLLGIIGSYFSYFAWINIKDPYLTGAHLSINPLYITASISILTWLFYTSAILRLLIIKKDVAKDMISATTLNALLFYGLGFFQLDAFSPQWAFDEQLWLMLVMTFGYLFLALVCGLIKCQKMVVVNLAIAFSSLAMIILLKMPQLGVSIVLSLEMGLVFILGLYYRERLYRYIAIVMCSLLLFGVIMEDFTMRHMYQVLAWTVPHDVLIISLVSVICFGLSLLTHRTAVDKHFEHSEKAFYLWFFPIVALMLLVWLVEVDQGVRWASVLWTLLSSLLLAIGFIFRHRVFRWLALSMLSLTALRVIFIDMSDVNTLYKIAAFTVLGALSLLISMIYSKFKNE